MNSIPFKKYKVQGRPLPKTTSPGIVGIMVRFVKPLPLQTGEAHE